MAEPAVIVVGASAGGIEALRQLLPTLPPRFPAAIAVVVHRADHDERFAAVLSATCALPVAIARDGDPLRAGLVVVGPAAKHLHVEESRFRLGDAPSEERARRSIDVALISAARTHGRRAAGVVLSGALDDGTAGLAAIKAAGGYAIVQAPGEALFDGMPRSALARVAVDAVLPLAAMAAALHAFVQRVDRPADRVVFDETRE